MSTGLPPRGPVQRRSFTETKGALKTTEFWIWALTVIGLLIAGIATAKGDGADDRFVAHDVWLFIAIASAAYMISRGLAKSGSREPYREVESSGDGASLTERVRVAADVLAQGPEAARTESTPTTPQPRL